MELKDQVCSLELSKRLKELGVKQESLWHWYPHIKGYSLCSNENFIHKSWDYDKDKPVVSAFTVAELGGRLPEEIKIDGRTLFLECSFTSHSKKVHYLTKDFHQHYEEANTEANARAKMLIYLLGNKLIEVGDKNDR